MALANVEGNDAGAATSSSHNGHKKHERQQRQQRQHQVSLWHCTVDKSVGHFSIIPVCLTNIHLWFYQIVQLNRLKKIYIYIYMYMKKGINIQSTYNHPSVRLSDAFHHYRWWRIMTNVQGFVCSAFSDGDLQKRFEFQLSNEGKDVEITILDFKLIFKFG